jgi:phosphoribosyl-ATP pyrophosphohydrolase
MNVRDGKRPQLAIICHRSPPNPLGKEVSNGRKTDKNERRAPPRYTGGCRATRTQAIGRGGSGAVRIAPAELETSTAAAEHEVDRLYAALSAVAPGEHPRTARLLAASKRKVAQKVIEEAGEVALAAVKHNNNGIIRESADLLYHLVVLWRRAGIDSATIWAEMRRRADTLGIAEKLPKSTT